MSYVIDWSPEGAAFYAKNSLQADSLFIEHVLHADENPYSEEDRLIDRLDGRDVLLDDIADMKDKFQHIIVQRLLDELPEDDSKLVLMRVSGCTYQSIADYFGFSVSTAYNRYNRIIKKMKEMFDAS